MIESKDNRVSGLAVVETNVGADRHVLPSHRPIWIGAFSMEDCTHWWLEASVVVQEG